MEYPKIETLFNRLTTSKQKGKVIEGEFRLPEFEMIDKWYLTEKIDGTNTRVILNAGSMSKPRFLGRTDNAQMPTFLLSYLQDTFTYEKHCVAFEPFIDATEGFIAIFGEGYGPRIQKGGNYRSDISLRIFDVFVSDKENPLGGWWLEPHNVKDIANKLGVKTVPCISLSMDTESIVDYVKNDYVSHVAFAEGGNKRYLMEGVVARTRPLLFTRRGKRLMWKLKRKDFK